MQAGNQRITPFLWFNENAEEAVNFYISAFPNSGIVETHRYTPEMAKPAGRPVGLVMTISFQLDGQDFTAINGGPAFKFTEAVSLVVNCRTQKEVDHYWEHLSAGGDPKAQRCGWLKDKYGLSWQIVPIEMLELITDPDPDKAGRAAAAMLGMKKIDLEGVKQAAA